MTEIIVEVPEYDIQIEVATYDIDISVETPEIIIETSGAPGKDGKDGVDGVDGIDGQPGADGVDGTNGIDGADGADYDPAEADLRYLQLTGGEMTGTLVGTYIVEQGVTIDTPPASAGNIGFTTDGLLRWTFGKGVTPEGGANTGAEFAVAAWDDGGNWKSNPVHIDRDTGTVSLIGLTVNGNVGTDWLDSAYGAWFGGQVIVDLDPVDSNHLTNKGYVDSRIWSGTQAELDLIIPRDPTVLYVVIE